VTRSAVFSVLWSSGDVGIFRRKVPSNYIPIHPDNVRKKDWVILLEAGTVIGPSADKLRVAKATLEKRIVGKYNIFLRKQHFLVLDDYDLRSANSSRVFLSATLQTRQR
jgi:hypothetical protein